MKTCSRCPNPPRSPKQRYCRACHAAVMRDYRERVRSRCKSRALRSHVDDLIRSIKPYDRLKASRSTSSVTFHMEPGQKPCARRCGRPRDLGYSAHCRTCRNAYTRENRTKHRDLPPAVRNKANCRAHTKALQLRGALPKGPCEGCGEPDAQNHHHWGYDKPRWFIRLCANCHRAVERSIQGVAQEIAS